MDAGSGVNRSRLPTGVYGSTAATATTVNTLISNGRLGRVEEGGEPDERHALFGRRGVVVLLRHRQHGDAQCAIPVGTQFLGSSGNRVGGLGGVAP